MAKPEAHKWEFKARFRRHAFGWKSQPIAKKEPLLAAEGAIAFIERVSPALGHVDSSSGSIGTAVNNAIAEYSRSRPRPSSVVRPVPRENRR